jgi:hypothetical protein
MAVSDAFIEKFAVLGDLVITLYGSRETRITTSGLN